MRSEAAPWSSNGPDALTEISISRVKSCQPMALRLPIRMSGDFGRSPSFGQLSIKQVSARLRRNAIRPRSNYLMHDAGFVRFFAGSPAVQRRSGQWCVPHAPSTLNVGSGSEAALTPYSSDVRKTSECVAKLDCCRRRGPALSFCCTCPACGLCGIDASALTPDAMATPGKQLRLAVGRGKET